MFKLEELPLSQLGGRVAGTECEKIVALVDAYVEASNRLYVTKVQTRDFVRNQQAVIALGRVLREAILEVTDRA